MTIITQVYSQYGAPMGRLRGQTETADACYAMPVPLYCGYDMGGAYWGCGQTVWAVIDQDGGSKFIRADDQDAAFDIAGVSVECRQSALPTEYAREYLAALIYGNAAEHSDAEEPEEYRWDDKIEIAQAAAIAANQIAQYTFTTLDKIASIADCY